MLLLGYVENKKYHDCNFHFRLEIDTLSPNLEWFDNENLTESKTKMVEGIYTLSFFRNLKEDFYNSDNVYETFHPVEILQLIDSNENWNVIVDDCYPTSSSELDNLFDTLANQITDEITDDSDLNEYFNKSSEIFQDLINDSDMIGMINNKYFYPTLKNYSRNFSDKWEHVLRFVTDNSIYNPKLATLAEKIIRENNLVEMFK